jgi:hypothetical protein
MSSPKSTVTVDLSPERPPYNERAKVHPYSPNVINCCRIGCQEREERGSVDSRTKTRNVRS